ncbi:MAG: DNA-binding protein [Rhodothermaeota bacterium MED-G64]|nr:MAG: DNA-binding protein [Rhodothermaeota bacterium MED-G64]
MEIDLVTREDLKDIVASEVSSLREEILAEMKRILQKPYLTNKELIRRTGWSSRTLQYLRDTRQIPFIKHGGKILYDSSDINDFLNRHKIDSRDA